MVQQNRIALATVFAGLAATILSGDPSPGVHPSPAVRCVCVAPVFVLAVFLPTTRRSSRANVAHVHGIDIIFNA